MLSSEREGNKMGKRLKSGIKEVRKTVKRKARNLLAKKQLKQLLKQAGRSIAAKAQDVGEMIRKAVSAIDKASERGILHKNTAARKKSRLLIRFNKTKTS